MPPSLDIERVSRSTSPPPPWCHARQIGDTFARIQHGDVVRDQLERITIACTDQHVKVGRFSPGRERADHIVGLVAFLFHVGDVEGLEHFLDQVELTSELIRVVVRFALYSL